MFTKEPGTLEWLQSFQPGAVFADIGANIGLYSIYAGVIARARVFAFEPESQNYAELNRSIFLNAGQSKITAYCMALGDKPVEVSQLLLNSMTTGGSFHDFATPSRDYAPDQRLAQGCVAFSLDYLVASNAIPFPDHVKIDVDGHEHKVLKGMQQILASGRLRTLLLECDGTLPHTHGFIRRLLEQGWVYHPDQVRLSAKGLKPAEMVENEIKIGTYSGNIIFARNGDDLAFAPAMLARVK